MGSDVAGAARITAARGGGADAHAPPELVLSKSRSLTKDKLFFTSGDRYDRSVRKVRPAANRKAESPVDGKSL